MFASPHAKPGIAVVLACSLKKQIQVSEGGQGGTGNPYAQTTRTRTFHLTANLVLLPDREKQATETQRASLEKWTRNLLVYSMRLFLFLVIWELSLHN